MRLSTVLTSLFIGMSVVVIIYLIVYMVYEKNDRLPTGVPLSMMSTMLLLGTMALMTRCKD